MIPFKFLFWEGLYYIKNKKRKIKPHWKTNILEINVRVQQQFFNKVLIYYNVDMNLHLNNLIIHKVLFQTRNVCDAKIVGLKYDIIQKVS